MGTDDYIPRSIAIAKLTKLEVTEPLATIYEAKRLIADMPTADAVPVVRCKDCKHFLRYGGTWCYRRTRWEEEIQMKPDDFCSYGQRKDGISK